MEELPVAEHKGRVGIFKESEDGRAAARHRGIERPGTQQPVAHVADRGVRCKDRLLEVVGHDALPLPHGKPQPLGKRHVGHPGPHAGIGFARRDPLGGLHHHERQSPQVDRTGRHHLAAPRAELRRVAHEEGRVAAQRRGTVDELPLRKPQVEEPVEGHDHRRTVGRAAPEPRTERNALVEADADAVHTAAVAQQRKGLQADVLLRRTVDRKALLHELRAGGTRARHLHLVKELPDGEHHRLEVVVSVRTAAQDVQPEIYFAVCFQDHAVKIRIF